MKNNNIITLSGENNQQLQFSIEAELEYEGFNYMILKPCDNNLGIGVDEAIVFRIENEEFFIEENIDIINEIEKLYNEGLE